MSSLRVRPGWKPDLMLQVAAGVESLKHVNERKLLGYCVQAL